MSVPISDPNGLVTVASFNMQVEAEFAMGRLRSAGIWCLLPEEHMAMNYAFGLTMAGGIRLQVRAEDETDALAILSDEGV